MKKLLIVFLFTLFNPMAHGIIDPYDFGVLDWPSKGIDIINSLTIPPGRDCATAIALYNEEVESAQFCTNPRDFVCQETFRDETQGNFQRFEQTLDQRFLAYARERYEDFEGTNVQQYFANRNNLSLYFDLRLRFKTELQNELAEDVRNNAFRQKLITTMTNSVNNEPNLSTEKKSNYLSIISRVKIVSPPRVPAGQSANNHNFIQNAYKAICGVDYSIPNASALTIGEEKFIILCSGLLATQTNSDMSLDQKFEKLVFVLGHELGHFLYESDESAYKKYARCLKKHPTSEQLKKEKTANIFKILFGDLRVKPHLEEIVSDFWGHRALGTYLNGPPPRTRRAEITARNYQLLCGIYSQDDGEHPSSQYRLNFLATADPQLRRAHFCPNPPDQGPQRVCSLE